MPELHEQDVVVVGGGLAGLTVARELRHAGLEVVVLEARERLGGRAHTARLGDGASSSAGRTCTGSSRTSSRS